MGKKTECKHEELIKLVSTRRRYPFGRMSKSRTGSIKSKTIICSICKKKISKTKK